MFTPLQINALGRKNNSEFETGKQIISSSSNLQPLPLLDVALLIIHIVWKFEPRDQFLSDFKKQDNFTNSVDRD